MGYGAMKRVLTALFCVLIACAAHAQEEDAFDDFENEIQQHLNFTRVADPLEIVNRGCFWLNDKLYFYALKPVAVGYKTILPEPARESVDNVFSNLGFPRRFVNNLLQLKGCGAAAELRNFACNSTAGVLGLLNVAEDHYHWKAHDEDFGQTLAYYGAGSWMAVHLPIWGPSNLRDALGMLPDYLLDPVSYIDAWGVRIALRSGDGVNKTSLNIGVYEDLKAESLDPYRFMQDAYEQNRQKRLKE